MNLDQDQSPSKPEYPGQPSKWNELDGEIAVAAYYICINSVKLPKIRRFRMSEAELVDFSEKLSHIEHEAHMAILRPVRALDEHLGFEWQTGCIVDADTDYLKSDFRGAVKDWALGLQGVSVTTLYA